MIANSRISPTLPAVDLKRARKFYHETLGLKIAFEDSAGVMFEGGGGSSVYLYQRGPTKADHTVASFEVEDIEREMKELSGK